MSSLSKSAQKVQSVLSEKGLAFQVKELSKSTRTAQEAADTIGCTVSQIVKSLVFQTKETKKPVLLLVSGTNRVNEKVISKIIGENIQRADADFVREVTGFAIGGIPPIAHTQPLQTFIDQDLLQYDELWAAAGTPQAVFSLKSVDLQIITGGTVISVIN